MADEGTLGEVNVILRAPLEGYTRDLRQAQDYARKFEHSVSGSLTNTGKNAEKAFRPLPDVFAKIHASIVGIIGLRGAGSLRDMADTWSDLQARLGAQVGGDNAPAVLERLYQVAQRTYSPLQQTAEAFIYNSRALRDLGYNTRQQLDFTETLNNALVVSGAKGQRAASIMNALSKAMAGGTLRGQELNTVIAQGGRVADLIADKMGVTVNELRKLGKEGKITTDVLFQSMSDNLELLRAQADAMPATVGDSFVRIGNAMLYAVGTFDKATGFTENLAVSLVGLGDVIASSVNPALNLGEAFVASITEAMDRYGISAENGEMFTGSFGKIAQSVFVGMIGGAAVYAVRALTSAVRVFSAALVATPIGAIVTALATFITAAYLFRDDIRRIFGVDVVNVYRDWANDAIRSMVKLGETIKFTWKNIGLQLVETMKYFRPMIVRALIGDLSEIKIFGKSLADFGLNVQAVQKALEGDNAGKFSKEMQDAIDAYETRLAEVDVTDYVQKLGDIAGAARETTGDLDDLAKRANVATAGGMSDKDQKAWDKLILSIKQATEMAGFEADMLGVNELASMRLREQKERLNEAIRAGLHLSPKQLEYLNEISAAQAEAEYRTKKLTEAFNFAKDSAKGFLSDIAHGLQQGKSIWEAFGDAVRNVLSKIIDKLMDLAVEAAFGGGSVTGGGGGLGGILTGVANMLFGGGGGAVGAPMPLIGAQLHGGGIAGSGGTARAIDPRLMSGAPRYHNGGIAGLAPDEVPAILRRGEPVGAAATGPSSVSMVFNINAQGSQKGAGEEIARALKTFVETPGFKNKVIESVNFGTSHRLIR